MNANMSHFMTRMTCSLIFGAGLFLLSAADASAHRMEYRRYIAHDHYVHGRTRSFPRWLRRNRDFRHWYLHSRYRFADRTTWHRIYDLYRLERRYHRHNRKFYGKVYHHNGYRTYHRRPKRHR